MISHKLEFDRSLPLRFPQSAPKRLHGCTQQTVDLILMGKGVRRDTGSWVDYECAKRTVFHGEMIETTDYERVDRWIQNYVGV